MAERIGVGLLGLGTVGSVVARQLVSDWELLAERCGGVTPVLRCVAMRDLQRERPVAMPETVRRTADPRSVVDDASVSVVIEVMGGVDLALKCVERGLQMGKHVVTANKALIAAHGPRLSALAAENGVSLWFEASVGAGLPVCALLRDSLRGERVTSVDAVINGTTNVILTRMQQDQQPMEAALAEAQRRGFAEADPSSDIDGWDAAYKLVIISWLAFGAHVDPSSVDRRGIRDVHAADLAYAARLGHTVKLVAHAAMHASRIWCQVRPALVPQGHPLYGVDDSENALLVRSNLANSVILRGLGAGGESTASAVLSDLVQAVRSKGTPPPPPARDMQRADPEEVEVCGYIRAVLHPVADASSLVVQALEDRGVPVVDAVDAAESFRSRAELLLLTGSAPRAVHDRALETLETLAAVHQVATAMDRLEL